MQSLHYDLEEKGIEYRSKESPYISALGLKILELSQVIEAVESELEGDTDSGQSRDAITHFLGSSDLILEVLEQRKMRTEELIAEVKAFDCDLCHVPTNSNTVQ
jgi:hypothetical protein